MSAKPVLRIGHPLLLQPAAAVREFNTPSLQALIRDMLDTLREANGAGLAAPQIGVLQRVVVFEVKDNPRYPGREPIPLTILVNPRITPLGEDTEEDWEGCLSVPGMRGWVPRHRRVRYTACDAEGRPLAREVEGFHARVVQHECDHLDGVLYPQRIRDLRKFGFEEELFQHEPLAGTAS